MTSSPGLRKRASGAVRAVIFDWGNTLMRNLGYSGPMCDWPRVELLPGTRDALTDLSKDFRLFAASNAGDSNAELMGRALARVGIRDRFERIWTARELGWKKPDPRFFEAAVRETGLLPAACAAVGDDYARDIVPAAAAGLRAVWLREGAEEPGRPLFRRSGEETAPEARAVIRSLTDLPDVLRAL